MIAQLAAETTEAMPGLNMAEQDMPTKLFSCCCLFFSSTQAIQAKILKSHANRMATLYISVMLALFPDFSLCNEGAWITRQVRL